MVKKDETKQEVSTKIDNDETKQATSTEENKKSKKVEVVKYRVSKTKNFVGFVHPKTRKFVTADLNKEFIIPKDDKEAIAILEEAADVNRI
ncbi:hypothetical protein BH747_12175 [Enterococcus villorum]|uniref:Uncharacterized protein n=1 Tax=Enterococcus villorum TaxID=112904 RepID=A0A1V8YP08_9ENTE|nr:hypothetical protein [Enterococcus villorum]OQO68428.1 hypothetical protein BH747_12175 [Enterococcus villorum]OQO74375.1 hypothetical protein BH744_07525 [Enterococcus villorum]